MEWITDIVKAIGPQPPIIILLLVTVGFLVREVWKRDSVITALHKEKESMYNQWREESQQRNDRVTNALNSSTLAISDHSANAESVNTTLKAIAAFMAGMAHRG